MLRRLTGVLAILYLAGLIAAGCGSGPPQAGSPQWTETDLGLKYRDISLGFGRQAQTGDIVKVHYTGWLFVNGTRGKVFDSSEEGDPIQFRIGNGQVIKGWDEGIRGMQEGAKRELLVPPELAYGESGAGAVIPPNATLNFTVELVKIVSQ